MKILVRVIQSGDDEAQSGTVAEYRQKWVHLGDVNEEELRDLRVTQDKWWNPHCLEEGRRRN